MKVQFLKDHDGDYTFGTEYLEGDVITLPNHNARVLIEWGACVEVKDEPVAEPSPWKAATEPLKVKAGHK